MATITHTIALRADSKKAIDTIKEYGDTVVAVTSKVVGMEASLGGDKVLLSANNYTAAIARLGGATGNLATQEQILAGASKLTESEKARLNSTITEAIAKYEALGHQAPTAMRQLAAATKTATNETKQADIAHGAWLNTVKTLAAAFVAMFTARAAYNFVKETIQEASALKDLGQQTHINVEELQLLAGAMSEFGVDAGTLGKGLYVLSRSIAGGDESVANGLHLMGMSLRDVEGLQGRELFLRIMDGLSTLQGGLRDTAASDLFGSRLGMAMGGASEGIRDAMATWQRLNTVISIDSINALDSYDEAIKRTEKSLSAIAANMMGPVAQGFNVVYEAVGKGASKLEIFVAMVKDFAASNTIQGASTEYLAAVLDTLNQKRTTDIQLGQKSTEQHKAAITVLTAHGQAAQFMAALELDAAKPLLVWQTEYLIHLKAIGELDGIHAAGIGVNAAQLKKYTTELEAAKKASEALAEAEKKQLTLENKMLVDTEKLWGEVYTLRVSQSRTATDAQIAHIHQWATEQELEARRAGVVDKSYYDALSALSAEKVRSITVDWNALTDAATKHSKAGLQQIADKAQATFQEALLHVGEWESGTIDKFQKTAIAAQRAADNWDTSFNGALDSIDAHLTSTASLVGTIPSMNPVTGVGMEGASPSLINYLSQGYDMGEAMALAGGYGATIGLPHGYWDATGWHSRAFGGSVAAGESYLVGERGPELFVPTSAGSVRPSGAGASAIQYGPFYITQPLGTPDAIARAVGAALTDRSRNLGLRAPTGA